MKLLRFIFTSFNYDFFYRKKYLINIGTKEVHKLEKLTNIVVDPVCTKLMSDKNKLYASQYDLNKFMDENPESNGCSKCYNELDTDKKFRK